MDKKTKEHNQQTLNTALKNHETSTIKKPAPIPTLPPRDTKDSSGSNNNKKE